MYYQTINCFHWFLFVFFCALFYIQSLIDFLWQPIQCFWFGLLVETIFFRIFLWLCKIQNLFEKKFNHGKKKTSSDISTKPLLFTTEKKIYANKHNHFSFYCWIYFIHWSITKKNIKFLHCFVIKFSDFLFYFQNKINQIFFCWKQQQRWQLKLTQYTADTANNVDKWNKKDDWKNTYSQF
jgi:hypothetical protein